MENKCVHHPSGSVFCDICFALVCFWQFPPSCSRSHPLRSRGARRLLCPPGNSSPPRRNTARRLWSRYRTATLTGGENTCLQFWFRAFCIWLQDRVFFFYVSMNFHICFNISECCWNALCRKFALPFKWKKKMHLLVFFYFLSVQHVVELCRHYLHPHIKLCLHNRLGWFVPMCSVWLDSTRIQFPPSVPGWIFFLCCCKANLYSFIWRRWHLRVDFS